MRDRQITAKPVVRFGGNFVDLSVGETYPQENKFTLVQLSLC